MSRVMYPTLGDTAMPLM